MSMAEADEPLSVTEIAVVRDQLAMIERIAQEFDAACQALVAIMSAQAHTHRADEIARDTVIRYLYTGFGYPPIPLHLIAVAFDLSERQVVAIVAGGSAVEQPDWLKRIHTEVENEIDPGG